MWRMISAPGEPPGSRVMHDLDAQRFEPVAKNPRMRRFAAAFAALEGDEISAHLILCRRCPPSPRTRREVKKADHSRSAPARNRPIISSVTASTARCDMLPLPTLAAVFSGCSSTRLSLRQTLSLPTRRPFDDRRRHRPGIDDARDNFLAAGLGHHDAHRARRHQRHAAGRAAEYLGVADGLPFGEQHALLEIMEAPFEQLLALIGALLRGLVPVDAPRSAASRPAPPSRPGRSPPHW